MSWPRKLYDLIPDWLWPHLTGDPIPAPNDHEYLSNEHSGLLNEVNRNLSSRLAQNEEHARSVDSKLLALLALASVLSVAVTASLAASTTLGRVEEDAKIFAWVAVVLVLFVAMQVLRVLWATVAGLVRRSYRDLSHRDLIPAVSETINEYQLRLLNLRINCMHFNEWVVDHKVSELAVAHTALRNALTATFALILLALVIASIHLA